MVGQSLPSFFFFLLLLLFFSSSFVPPLRLYFLFFILSYFFFLFPFCLFSASELSLRRARLIPGRKANFASERSFIDEKGSAARSCKPSGSLPFACLSSLKRQLRHRDWSIEGTKITSFYRHTVVVSSSRWKLRLDFLPRRAGVSHLLVVEAIRFVWSNSVEFITGCYKREILSRCRYFLTDRLFGKQGQVVTSKWKRQTIRILRVSPSLHHLFHSHDFFSFFPSRRFPPVMCATSFLRRKRSQSSRRVNNSSKQTSLFASTFAKLRFRLIITKGNALST